MVAAHATGRISFMPFPVAKLAKVKFRLTSHGTSEGIDYDGKDDGRSRVTRCRWTGLGVSGLDWAHDSSTRVKR